MSKLNKIRVPSHIGAFRAVALQQAGYQARWLGAGTASTSYAGGCTDSSCCWQHKSAKEPQKWGSIETDASGSQARKIFRALELEVADLEWGPIDPILGDEF